MKISRLRSTKNGKRVNLYIDGKYRFSISRGTLTEFSLYEEKTINQKALDDIREFDLMTYNCALACDLITRRPRSEKEIVLYLGRKLRGNEYSDKLIKKIIKRLKKKGYIDDFQFASWWIRNRIAFKPRGKYLIKRELMMKGVKRQVIEETLVKEGPNQKQEYETAMKLGEKKLRLLENEKDDDKKKKKFIGYIARKGFSIDLAFRVYKNLIS